MLRSVRPWSDEDVTVPRHPHSAKGRYHRTGDDSSLIVVAGKICRQGVVSQIFRFGIHLIPTISERAAFQRYHERFGDGRATEIENR